MASGDVSSGRWLKQVSYGLVASMLALGGAGFAASRLRSEAARVDGGAGPYATLGVPHDADRQAIVKAYRALALRWHPDRNRGAEAGAEAAFAKVSHAYDVLTDPTKRDVYDRLGERGLERLQDGDPSVRKDWLPPDEVLRRLHDDGDEPWLQSLVTGGFASLTTFWAAWERLLPSLRGLAVLLGVDSEFPSVVITATDTATGAALRSGASAAGDVTFKLVLSGKSVDFAASDVVHTCARGAKFLGMKTTYYLQCAHVPGLEVSVRVDANAFSVASRHGTNAPSETFALTMV